MPRRPAPPFPEHHVRSTQVMREGEKVLANQSSHGCQHPGRGKAGEAAPVL